MLLVVDARTIEDFALIAQTEFTTVTFVVHFTEPSLFPDQNIKHFSRTMAKHTWHFHRVDESLTKQSPNCIRESEVYPFAPDLMRLRLHTSSADTPICVSNSHQLPNKASQIP
jgi:hypothetical protein